MVTGKTSAVTTYICAQAVTSGFLPFSFSLKENFSAFSLFLSSTLKFSLTFSLLLRCFSPVIIFIQLWQKASLPF